MEPFEAASSKARGIDASPQGPGPNREARHSCAHVLEGLSTAHPNLPRRASLGPVGTSVGIGVSRFSKVRCTAADKSAPTTSDFDTMLTSLFILEQL